MSVPEVGHRLGRSLRINLEGLGLFSARKPPPPMAQDDAITLTDLTGLNSSLYVEAAERLLAGDYSVFAVSSDVSKVSSLWNRDPLTGIVAPLTFGKRIDYRDERLVGNIKYLWEPNRHLELVTLAQAYALTSDNRYLLEVGQRIDSWLEQCPYPYGANWASSLEIGIRLINWSLVWQLIGGKDSALFSGEEGAARLSRWLDSIYQHSHFIRHYYSRYSSANNHLIGEAAGVFIAACTWPYWRVFSKWGEEARLILNDAAEAQTHADGVNREQAVAYQQFVLDFFILAALAARARGVKFSDAYWQTIERMMEYIQAIMDVGGNVPMIGDADDGYVVRLSQETDFCPFRSLLATGAILFSRPDFAAKSGGLDDKTRFLLGDDRWADLSSRIVEATDTSPREFPEGGYYILGQDLNTENEIRMVTDAGPLGYLSIAAHGHADALSFVLSVAGREILVDPGTYSYHTEPKWREFFRGTGAHNTVRIDGQDQSVQGGNFMWLQHANARCKQFEYNDTGSRFCGEHDGYARLSDPVLHKRNILQRGNMIEVTDRIACDGYHVVERCWHFSEQSQVSMEGSTVVVDNGPVRAVLRPLEPVVEFRHLRGSDNPPGGWISRRFDVKGPIDSVYFVNEINGTVELKTTIECEIRDAGGSLGEQGE